MTESPIAWTIAGSDSSGGAGIQADLATFERLGVYGCSVVTAVTAQSTRGVERVEPVAADLVEAQIRALESDLRPGVVKLGMLASADTVRRVAALLPSLEAEVICDPVLSSTSETALLEADALPLLRDEVIPRCDLLTPNLPEAERLLRRPLRTDADIAEAAGAFLDLGARAVLIKGGHRAGPWAQDYYADGHRSFWLTGPRVEAHGNHGTGCVLASAWAAFRAGGLDPLDATVLAKAYVTQGLRSAAPIGGGNSPIARGGWPHTPQDLPWVTDTADQGRSRPRFPSLPDPAIGLYPIVDSAGWVERLAPLGLRAIQLRIKDPSTSDLESQIARAIRAVQGSDTLLFINDHWRPAMRFGAAGVHLGQDDLASEAVRGIEAGGLLLGISTHSYYEIARALAFRPSYIAIGTLFRTTSKVMDYAPLGLPAFTRMRRLVDLPVVAIGGIHLDRATAVRKAGADGMAVISEIRDAPDLLATVRAWQPVARR